MTNKVFIVWIFIVGIMIGLNIYIWTGKKEFIEAGYLVASPPPKIVPIDFTEEYGVVCFTKDNSYSGVSCIKVDEGENHDYIDN